MLATPADAVADDFTHCTSQVDSVADHMLVFRFLQIGVIEKKLPWIIYNDAFDALVEAKTTLRNAEESLAQRKKDFMDSQEPLR